MQVIDRGRGRVSTVGAITPEASVALPDADVDDQVQHPQRDLSWLLTRCFSPIVLLTMTMAFGAPEHHAVTLLNLGASLALFIVAFPQLMKYVR